MHPISRFSTSCSSLLRALRTIKLHVLAQFKVKLPITIAVNKLLTNHYTNSIYTVLLYKLASLLLLFATMILFYDHASSLTSARPWRCEERRNQDCVNYWNQTAATTTIWVE